MLGSMGNRIFLASEATLIGVVSLGPAVCEQFATASAGACSYRSSCTASLAFVTGSSCQQQSGSLSVPPLSTLVLGLAFALVDCIVGPDV